MASRREDLLQEWDGDLRLICHAHYDAAVAIGRRNYILGLPAVGLSALVGTSVFASLGSSPGNRIRILVGLTSLAAATLGSLQTFLKFAERAEKHRRAGAEFGSLLKEMEQIRVAPPADDRDFDEWASSFRERWDRVSLQSLTVPPSIWKRHRRIHKRQSN